MSYDATLLWTGRRPQCRKKGGQVKRRKPAPVSEGLLAEMFADYQRLQSLPKTAALHGRKFPTVWKLFVSRGLIQPKPRKLPRETVNAMYADYLRLRSLEKVGNLWSRTRQSVYDIFQNHGLKCSPKRPQEDVRIWQDRKFTRDPQGYWRATVRRKGVPYYLHKLTWIEHQGAIPAGWDVMFKDGDRDNCAIDNLDCLPKAEVSRRTATGENQHTKKRDLERMLSVENWTLSRAGKFALRFGLSTEDFAQEGRKAALKASRTFDAGKGFKFLTYARMPIDSAMDRFGRKNAHAVHVPLAKFYSEGISSRSLDAPVGEESDACSLGDLMGADETITSEIDVADRAGMIAKMLGRLSAREREIIKRRFFQEHTLEEIAGDYGLSRERIRQIEAKALATLRRSRNLKRIAA